MTETERARKKSSEQLQAEYDDIITKLKNFSDGISQSEKALEHYNSQLEDATDDKTKRALEKQIAETMKNNIKLKAEKAIYESSVQDKKEAIQRVAKKKHLKVGDNRLDEIEAEKYEGKSSSFSTKTFMANLKSRGGGGRFGVAAGVMNVLGQIANVATDMYIAERKKELNTWQAQQDIYLKTIETSGKIFQRNMKTFSKGMQGALSSSFASITQGVQEGAYAAASTSISFATETLANTYDTAVDKLVMSNYNMLRQQQAEYENLLLRNQQISGGVNAASSILGMFGPVGAALGGLAETIASNALKIQETNSEIEIKHLEQQNKVAEEELNILNETKKMAIESAQEAVSKVLDFANAIETLSKKTDAAAMSMANIIGMSTNNVNQYESFVYNAARNLSFKDSRGKTTYLNKDAEDLLKMQSQYIEESGRSGTMSQKDFIKTFQLGEVLGDDNLAATLLGDMDYFNKSIATGTDLIFEMFQAANKAGVSNRKFAKDLQQNLKLAQKYTFKGGTEAMMKMAIWAQKTRFNMQNLEGMVDRIQEGGLEGVITQGAKLQVLGGNMAMGADPIAMMYEAWADPEALMKRFNDMTRGVGHFNSKTGEVDITGPDAMRLKAFAEAAGMDYTDARAQITQRIKGEQIDKQLTANYSDEQKALIYNKAKLGKNGEWEVTLNDGTVKSINDLKDKDWNSLMPIEQSINDYVAGIYGLLKGEGGVTKNVQAVMADETFDNLKKNVNDRMTENLTFVANTSGTLKSMVERSNDFVTAQNEQQHKLMAATTNILDTQFELIKKATQQTYEGIANEGTQLKKALAVVNAELDYAIAKANVDNAGDNPYKKMIANARLKVAEGKLKEVTKDFEGELNIKGADTRITESVVNWAKSQKQRALANGLSRIRGGFLTGEMDMDDVSPSLLKELYNNNVITKGDADELTAEDERKIKEEVIPLIMQHEQELLEKGEINAAVNNTVPFGTAAGYEMNDGIISNNNAPIVSAASNVTKINDGLVQSDPKDVAIFAKEGGVIGNFLNSLYKDVHSAINGTVQSGNGNVKVEISGRLDISDGKNSFNVMDEWMNNPLFVRALSRMLAKQLTDAFNGGRGTANLALGSR